MKKVLVAYFSASGITAKVAHRLAQAIKADIFEIKPKVLYTKDDLNWTDRQSRTSVEMRNPDCRPPLAQAVPNVSNYEVVFIGFPIWWYREPSIIDTFMEACAWNGQTVLPFATSGGSGLGEASSNMQKLAAKAHLKTGKVFSSNASNQELAAWAKETI